MPNLYKIIDQLTVKDLSQFPVWEYESEDAVNRSDRRVTPVNKLPVHSTNGRLLGVLVRLGNGTVRWAVLSNITLRNPKKTKHFLTIWLEHRGKWFGLARYFDVDYPRRGPQALAEFLGIPTSEVFPITYDISGIAEGDIAALQGQIDESLEARLTEDEIISLALADD